MEVIKNLEEISFTNKFIQNRENFYNLINNNNKKKVKKQKNNIMKKKENPEYIENANKLWFIFVMIHGIEEYELTTKKMNIETKLRYNLIDKIKETDTSLLLKANKFKPQEIINDLGNMGNIEMNTFKALCIILEKNYCLKHKRLCEIRKNSDNNLFYIIDDDTMYINQDTNKNIEETMYIVKSLDKPFKSISAYKVADLKEICMKLGLLDLEDENKKIKKNDYYMKLKEY